jgi:hypothetical protein
MVFVEQIGNDPFNKGILMNSAVKEITRIVIKELILQNASMIGMNSYKCSYFYLLSCRCVG